MFLFLSISLLYIMAKLLLPAQYFFMAVLDVVILSFVMPSVIMPFTMDASYCMGWQVGPCMLNVLLHGRARITP